MAARQTTGLFLGPLLFALLLLLPAPEGLTDAGMAVAAVALLMAVWWVSEALPIPATALLPIALFPLLGVMQSQQVTNAYANHLIYLFMGGFLIAVTMEKWQLHKRIALHTIRFVGVSPRRIILGFMLATAFLSMWISNTATAMMMATIGLAVMRQVKAAIPGQSATDAVNAFPFGAALMLGIAYAASIGGVATLIGTPPNAILAGIVKKTYGISIGFAEWMLFAFPLSVVMLLLTWYYLVRFVYRSNEKELPGGKQAVEQALSALGKMTKQETRGLIVFVCVASAWILRSVVNIESLSMVTDSTIAILGALALFVIPSDFGKREFLLDWRTAVKIPWDIIILFGGGFALAEGFNSSGLTLWIANQLTVLEGTHIVILVAVIVLLVIFLTELTSNTATASLLLPIMGAFAIAMNIHPLATMTAVAVAASYAFMLP
ncbi:MAG: DASS family sodium-coupled anion symporter, partial [Gammaproteobacteria bacterium]|nr:DASS family sodium-coupled anion symporter [Gammaproteobacteria bacterium]